MWHWNSSSLGPRLRTERLSQAGLLAFLAVFGCVSRWTSLCIVLAPGPLPICRGYAQPWHCPGRYFLLPRKQGNAGEKRSFIPPEDSPSLARGISLNVWNAFCQDCDSH